MIEQQSGHHVYPLNDLKDHILDAKGSCWCKPDDECGIYIHHSMDRREEYERGRKVS